MQPKTAFSTQSNVYAATVAAAIAQVIVFFLDPVLVGVYGADGLAPIEGSLSVILTAGMAWVLPSRVGKVKVPTITMIFAALLTSAAPAVAQDAPGRIILKTRRVGTGTTSFEIAEHRIAPMVVVNAAAIPLERRATFEAGVDVGGCYAWMWSPSWWDRLSDSVFMAIGACFEMGLTVNGPEGLPEGTTALTLQPAGVIALMRWVQIGIGYRHRISLVDGGRDSGEPVLLLGIAAANF
jgi:hypothetical protein